MRNAILFSMLGILLATVSHRDYAQIPNAGFEGWNSGAPDSWLVNNVTGFYTTVAQSADAHTGSSAAAGTVVAYNTNAIPPSLVSGSNYVNGFPVNARHAAVHMWYKFAPVSGDHLSTTVFMQKGGNVIGTGLSSLTVAQTSYTENVVDITYYTTTDVPDTCLIAITITGSAGLGHVGSTFFADDLTFGASTGVETSGNIAPESYQLSQNYPNPFNPSTRIGYSIPASREYGQGSMETNLVVYDLLGREVAVLVNEKKAPGSYQVTFNASGLASGVYLYRLTAGEFVQIRKLVLLK
jgi:hypothetical protein